MQIRVLMIGKVRESYLKAGISIYLSRIAPFHHITLVEIDRRTSSGINSAMKIEQERDAEGHQLLQDTRQAGAIIALDPRGESWTSEDLAHKLHIFELKGRNPVFFLIGGVLGIPPFVLDQSDSVLSLSRMTFPHQMVPLLLLEQLYRASCINRNIPYHK
jgi:23S rRNA (pseudouridine1915-N3)-methyltransferase